MEDIKINIANNLKHYRKLRNVTQKQLADFLGLKDNTISTWEKGINSIDVSILIKICDYLKVSLNEIYGLKENIKTLTNKETALIDKYRTLDERGKHTINTVLDMEYNRHKQEYLMPIAAHDKKNIDKNSATYEEDNKHDLDIMMNDDEWK